MDVDTPYHGLERVLPLVDYMIASSNFPLEWTGRNDPLEALQDIQREYRMPVAAMTLGAHGALALERGEFVYSPGLVVNCVDTTGAGDVFHGAFCYAVVKAMPLPEALEFSNAMAALNCTELGARGGIRGAAEARFLLARAERRVQCDLRRRVQPPSSPTE
jgi:sugar/nucleoside kinase (ribokinase family)